MAGCPDVVAVIISSMESTCLRTRSLPTCGPICGHSMSSPVMRSTASFALFTVGTGLCRVGSEAEDSLFLVALCTDVLRRRPWFAALQSNSTRGVERFRRRACKILRDMTVSRDGLDHILDAVKTQPRSLQAAMSRR